MNELSPPPPRGLLSKLRHACHTMVRMCHVGWVAAERAERSESPQNESRRRGFEIADANTIRIALLCIGLVIFVALSMVAVTIIYNQRIKTQNHAFGPGYQGGASQRTPIEDTWKALDAETAAHLGGYRWVDKERGEVQMPIDRAMDLIQEKQGGQP